MEKIYGRFTKYIECINLKRNKWMVRWDAHLNDDGTSTYMEEEFDHQPELDEIKRLVIGWYNSQIDNQILSGMVYDGVPVWLSKENQFNYKAAYDFAMQTGGKNLPITFKFGTDETPVYRTFATVEEITDFMTASIQFLQKTLSEGWSKKEAVDWSVYK